MSALLKKILMAAGSVVASIGLNFEAQFNPIDTGSVAIVVTRFFGSVIQDYFFAFTGTTFDAQNQTDIPLQARGFGGGQIQVT